MVVKFLRTGLFFMLLLCLVVNQAQAGRKPGKKTNAMGEVSLRGRIVEVNEENSFVVINLGSADGIKQGMILSVFQRDEEAAKVKVEKVRRHISACDIQLVYSGRGIAVGDLVYYQEKSPLLQMLKPLESTRIIEVEPIVVDIDAPKQIILKRVLTVLQEFGVMITESDPTKYSIKAKKHLNTPLRVQAMTEWGPFVKDSVYYTAEVTTTPRFNRLVIRLRGVYDREGRLYDHQIKKTSSTYKEAQEIAFRIKDLSEEI